jgi:hypothetical protein
MPHVPFNAGMTTLRAVPAAEKENYWTEDEEGEEDSGTEAAYGSPTTPDSGNCCARLEAIRCALCIIDSHVQASWPAVLACQGWGF